MRQNARGPKIQKRVRRGANKRSGSAPRYRFSLVKILVKMLVKTMVPVQIYTKSAADAGKGVNQKVPVSQGWKYLRLHPASALHGLYLSAASLTAGPRSPKEAEGTMTKARKLFSHPQGQTRWSHH
jgi:hypothetical protein